MKPVLQQIVKKHFQSTGELNPAVIALLEDLEQTLTEQEADNTLQTVLDSMPFGVTLIDQHKHILHANQSALEMMGYNALDELVGHLCHDTLCPAAEGQCPILDLKQTVDRADRILVTRDKQRVPILKSVTPITYQGQEVLLEAFIDITEQKHMEQERAKAFEVRGELARNTNEIIKHLAGFSKTSEIYSALPVQVLEHFQLSRVQVFTYNQVANNLRLVETAGQNAELPTAQRAILPAGVGAAGKAAATKSISFADQADLQLEHYPQMLAPDIQIQAAIPVMNGDNLLGVLDLQDNRPEMLNQDTVLFMETLAIQAGIMIDTLNQRAEMEQSFDELSVLQRRASIEGWLEFAETNPLQASRFIFDQNLDSVVPLEVSAAANEDGKNVIANPLEVRGSVIGALGIADDPDQPLTPEEVQLLESVSTEVAEALERARLFESSQRSASELAVLNEMGATFAQAATEEFINETIFNYTTKLMKAPQFYIANYDPAEEQISFPFVVMDGQRIREDMPEYETWLPRPVGTGLTGYIITNRLPILIDSNAEQTLEQLGLPYMQFGGSTQSFLGVPMVIGDRTLGVISVQCEDTANLYSRHHLDLLTTIASQAAVSINNTRLFQQEQERAQQERTVRTITDKVRRGANTQAIMQIALEELSQVLNADVSTIQLGSPEQLLTAAADEPVSDEEDQG